MQDQKAPRLNLIGETYGRLTVIAVDHVDDHGHTFWRVRCSCVDATEKAVRGNALRTGGTQSCGCLAREIAEAKKQEAKENRHHHREPQEEGAAPRDLLDYFVTCWRRLNSEDESVIKATKLSLRKRIEQIVTANAKARDLIHSPETSPNGLADDIE